MSDFEKSYQRITGGKVDTRLQAYCEDIWNAAIASMQGEAEPVGNDLVERLKHSNTCYDWINRQNQEAAAEIARLQTRNDQLETQLSMLAEVAESKDVEIARLTKELDEAKNKEREFMWERLEHMRTSIHLLGRHYQKEDLAELKTYLETNVARIDAAIRQIGGGE